MLRQVKMWRQNNAAPKCGFRHKCGGASEMMEMWLQTMWRQAMWRQAQMWWQSEMWRQTMRRQNVASDTPFAKLSSRKCVFKKGIQWQAQKCYTKCLRPALLNTFFPHFIPPAAHQKCVFFCVFLGFFFDF